MCQPKKKKSLKVKEVIDAPVTVTVLTRLQESDNDWRDHLTVPSPRRQTEGTKDSSLSSSLSNGKSNLDLQEGLHALCSASTPNIEMIRM